jgi:excisionase family DNA binding protein
MTTAKGSHLLLVDGSVVRWGRSYAGLAGVFGKAQQATQRPLTQERARKRTRPDDALLTVEEVAARLQVSKKQVRKFVEDGLLRYINLGRGSKHRAMRFQPADVEECLTQLTKRNVPCQSTRTLDRHTTNIRSQSAVIGFTARLNARRAEKPKR